MAKVSVCVVGLGHGRRHARVYAGMGEVDLFLCEADEGKLRQFAEELRPKGVFRSWEEAAKSPQVQALDIALPHHLHRDAVVAALGAGKHVMVEKPLARTLEEADEMLEAARKAGVLFLVAEDYRFMPQARRARELIEQGKIGEVFHLRSFEMWEDVAEPPWRAKRELMGGGELIDSGVHLIHLLRMLGGEVEWVFAAGTRFKLEMEGEDTAHLLLGFKGGAVGALTSGWAARFTEPHSIFSVYGTKGCIFEFQGKLLLWSEGDPEFGEGPREVEVPHVDRHEALCRHFVKCLLGEEEPEVPAEEGRKDLEVAVAAYRSMREGRAVRLPL